MKRSDRESAARVTACGRTDWNISRSAGRVPKSGRGLQKRLRQGMSLTLSLAMTVTLGQGMGILPEQMKEVQAADASRLSNPRIVEDNSMTAGQKVTWDCVYFGEYPQAEVVTQKMSENYTAIGSDYLAEGDLVVSDSVYHALESATGWDAQGDLVYSGQKYRRMKREDATYFNSGRSNYYNSNYYKWSDSDTYHYFQYQPIKWRVLSTDGADALLLADKGLDDQRYNTEYTNVTWETSTIRSWLNGYGSSSNAYGTDYSSRNFLDTAFTGSEQSAINQAALENPDNISDGTEGGNDTADYVYLLSEAEVDTDAAKDYGFVSGCIAHDEARRSRSSTYAKAMGTTWWSTVSRYAGNCWWWLRSAGSSSACACVYGDGDCWVRDGGNVHNGDGAVRPALNLHLSSSDFWSYAGTVCSDGTVDVTGSGLPEHPSVTEAASTSSDRLQCQSACTVEEGSQTSILAHAYGDSYEDLKDFSSSVTWTSADTSVVQVTTTGFVLPLASTKFHSDAGDYESWQASGIVMVQGIAAGTTTVTGTGKDGEKTSFEVTVSEKVRTVGIRGEGSGGTMSIGGDMSGSTGDDQVKNFFPGDFSLKLASLPVDIKKSEKADGSYTIKGSIGINASNIFDDEKSWLTFVNNCNAWDKAEKKMDTMRQLREMFGGGTVKAFSASKFEKIPEVTFIGYFETKYDKNGNIISQNGKLIGDFDWKASMSWQFMTAIGPLYINLSGGGKLTCEIDPDYDAQKKKVEIAGGSIKITPNIALEGGYGIDKVAQIGAKGELSVPITVYPFSKATWQAKASVHIKLLFVFDTTYTLAQTNEHTLWDTNKKTAAKYGLNLIGQDALSEMDTSFAQKTNAWSGKVELPGGKKPLKNSYKKTSGKTGEVSGQKLKQAENMSQQMKAESVLQDGVLESTRPLMAEIDGKKVMVFQAYDETKDVINSTVLKYSVYEDGIWSQPQKVWDEPGADLYADLKKKGSELLLVWQKEKTELSGNIEEDGEKLLSEMAEQSEICFARFDPAENAFTGQHFVTDNSEADMMPQIMADGDAVISYIRNDKKDMMQISGTNRIYTMTYQDGIFGEEECLGTAPGTIDQYVLYPQSGRTEAIYVGQSEDMSAVFDQDGRILPALEKILAFADQGTVSFICYADGKLQLIKNGILYLYDPKTDAVKECLAGESSFGQAVQYCSNGTKSGYIWSVYQEETDTGSIVASMKTEDGFSEPVTLHEQTGKIYRTFAPVLDGAGNWQIIANAYDTETELHALVDIEKLAEEKISLVTAYSDEMELAEDGTVKVHYMIQNTGDEPVDQVEVSVTAENGQTVRKKLSISLQPGEAWMGDVPFDFTDVSDSEKLTIAMQSENQTDLTDTTAEDTLETADISVEGTAERIDGGMLKVTAVLQNQGIADAKTDLHIYQDETKTKELAQCQDSIHVKAGDSVEKTWEIALSDITYNESGAAYLVLKADSADSDYNLSNNEYYIILYQEDENDMISPSPSDSGMPEVTGSPLPDSSGVPASSGEPAVSEKPVASASPFAPTVLPSSGAVSPTPIAGNTLFPSGGTSPAASTSPTVPPVLPSSAAVPPTPIVGDILPPFEETDPYPAYLPTLPPSGEASTDPAYLPTLPPSEGASPAPAVRPSSGTVGSPAPFSQNILPHTPAPSASVLPAKGEKLTSPDGDVYQVLKAGKTVSYISPDDPELSSVKIPAKVTLDGTVYQVTKLAAKAFRGNRSLKKAVIGKNVQTIGKEAFYGCKKLKDIRIKTKKLTVASVGKKAFSGISQNAVVSVPAGKRKTYQKLLKKRGMNKETQVIQ